jgi:peptide/nickel transport system substrate-binding protein
MRKALSYAIDRQVYIDIMFDGKGVYNVYQPPAEFGWTQEKAKEKFKQNKELARQLLKEAGYKGEPILWTGYPGGAVQNTPDSGSIIFQQVKEVGFNFKPEWLADNVAQRQRFVAGTWGTAFWSIAFFGWDPDDYLGFFDSKSPNTLNFSRVKDPVLDRMIAAQSSEMNPAKRKELLDKVQDYLYDKMYFIPVAREYNYKARQGYVRMKPIHYSTGFPGVERAWLDK